ncbi:conjugative relaxase [Novosphingobium sp. G106]|uniref:MobF family relaxase n=1 Tax=Novosphingobium sp. G106 TaxID=2849500 RepID=UPI001C2CFDB6|nr:MobF family relaxase [Novosphingobium sp. G106]MBV1692718.1 conjugative relaxase [Novosphingobium sp. G106]
MTVSMGAVRSAGGAAKYFASDNYYTAEQAEAASEWSGGGAADLGLAGTVDRTDFEGVLGGKLPGGKQVGEEENRAHGTDFTFSMSKSASLLAYVSGDKRLLAANMAAVKETMAWAEANLAEARIKKDGKAVPIRTGNLVYALFPHDTSRSLDPQAHIHAVVANLTRLPKQFRNPDRLGANGEVIRDDGWRAWHNGEMWKANAVLAAIYHSALRDKIEQLGYTTRLAGKHGAFEIVGVNREAIDGFSKRREDIKAKAEALGIKSREGLLEVTLRTRDPKLDAGDRAALGARWREEAKSYDYNGDKVFAAALDRSRERSGMMERGAIAVGAAVVDARSRLADFLRRPHDPLVDQGLARITLLPSTARTQFAVASAIRILAEREAAFRSNDVLKTALNLGLKGVTHEKVERRMAQLAEKGELIPEKSERYDGAIDLVTTREALRQERRILLAMDAGVGQARPLMQADAAAAKLQELAGERKLNPEQLSAAIQMVSSENRIVLVQGRAGAGKSTMLQPVAKAEALDAAARLLAARGKKAMLLTADTKGDAKALAFQNKMVADLKADTGLEALTVHSFLFRNEKFLSGQASAGAFAARKTELQGTYLILDEASMISNEQMDKLTALANLMEVGRLAIVGDRKQLSAIEAGKSFAVMQARTVRDELPLTTVNTNMRQQTPLMRAVADLADLGQVRAAIELLGERVVQSDDRVLDAAQAWLALVPEDRATTTLLPSSREGRGRANEIIQDGLRSEGTLTGEGRVLTVRERVNVAHEELRYAHFWKDARILEVGDSRNSLGLDRGDYRIERIYANGRIGLRDERGRRNRIDPAKIDPMNRRDGLQLSNDKTIRVHEGETIRWTANDKSREMWNATIARVEKVDRDQIVVRLASGDQQTLRAGDPMLKRIDLAYAINTHMAQGITNETVFAVMGSAERNLSNARSFLVNLTRQRSDVRLFTDDAHKLARQLESNRGNKSSALETVGELRVEALLSGRGKAFDPGPLPDDLGMPGERRDGDPLRGSAAGEFAELVAGKSAVRAGTAKRDHGRNDLGLGPEGGGLAPGTKAPVRDQPELDRSKGLEL